MLARQGWEPVVQIVTQPPQADRQKHTANPDGVPGVLGFTNFSRAVFFLRVAWSLDWFCAFRIGLWVGESLYSKLNQNHAQRDPRLGAPLRRVLTSKCFRFFQQLRQPGTAFKTDYGTNG